MEVQAPLLSDGTYSKNECYNHLNSHEETELLTSLYQDTAAINQVACILSTQVGRGK